MSGDLHVARPSLIGHAAPLAPPAPPASAAPPAPAERALANVAIAAAYEDARLRILRSLERGEIDVVEAGRRLETLDAGDVAGPPAGGDPTTADAGGERDPNG
jgi:hypothetical protein